jgi:hypothetical protein
MSAVPYITDRVNRFTVIDEADEMLSDGWEEIMDKLFQGSGLFQCFPIVAQADFSSRREFRR